MSADPAELEKLNYLSYSDYRNARPSIGSEMQEKMDQTWQQAGHIESTHDRTRLVPILLAIEEHIQSLGIDGGQPPIKTEIDYEGGGSLDPKSRYKSEIHTWHIRITPNADIPMGAEMGLESLRTRADVIRANDKIKS